MTFGRVVCARKPVNRLEMLVPLENWSGIKMFWIRHTGLIEYIFEKKNNCTTANLYCLTLLLLANTFIIVADQDRFYSAPALAKKIIWIWSRILKKLKIHLINQKNKK